MKILVDTDIIIDVLRDFKSTIKLLKELTENNDLYISGITKGEIFSGKEMENEEKRKKTEKFLLHFNKVNPENEIFKLAGDIRRKYNVTLADGIIAATALKIDAELLTRNRKDFEKIDEVKLFNYNSDN